MLAIRCCALFPSAGLQGGAGSGGSHIGVTVVGGRVGIDVTSSQPAPTLTAITLIGQLETALVYGHPGRQTLSVTGLNITTLPNATGPAIAAGAPISIYDGAIDRPGRTVDTWGATAIHASSNIFVRDVFVRGFAEVVATPVPSDSVTPATTPADWTRLAWFANGVGASPDAGGSKLVKGGGSLRGSLFVSSVRGHVTDSTLPAAPCSRVFDVNDGRCFGEYGSAQSLNFSHLINPCPLVTPQSNQSNQ